MRLDHFNPIRLGVLSICLSSLTAAVQARSAFTATYTQEECFTKLGTSSVQLVPTSTQFFTLSLQLPVVVASSATSTASPAPITVTKTTTSTATTTSTNMQVTSTFTTTTTPTTTTTTVSTITSTQTVTSTVASLTTITTAGTTTVSTASGYTPLASQLTSQGYTPHTYTGNQRRQIDKSLAAVARAGSLLARAKGRKSKLSRPAKYPQSVQCEVEVESVTYRPVYKPCHKTTTVTVAPSTSTATSTVTVTSTSTVAPPSVSKTVTSTAATRTSTSTQTASTTTTTITVETQTMTVQQPAATQYAACQSNNIIDEINGNVVDSFRQFADDLGETVQTTTSATSTLECCAACQQNPTCTAYAFWLDFNVCQFVVGGTGSPNYYLGFNDATGRSYVAGNGATGMVGVMQLGNGTSVD